jgi:hypothetical protein
MFGKTPHLKKWPYFGLPDKGKVFTREEDAIKTKEMLESMGHGPMETVRYECREE